jgi:hypothetical protein
MGSEHLSFEEQFLIVQDDCIYRPIFVRRTWFVWGGCYSGLRRYEMRVGIVLCILFGFSALMNVNCFHCDPLLL